MTGMTPGTPAGLGDPWRWSYPPRDPWSALTWAAVAGLSAAALMAVAGLPPVDLHGVAHRFGVMDPLCGGTRAVRLAARGQWADSWTYNPIGIPLVLGATVILARGALGWATGRWVTLHVTLSARQRRGLKVLAAVGVVALGVNQQAHAALLLRTG